jgi:lysophospholipase L1-like esterase
MKHRSRIVVLFLMFCAAAALWSAATALGDDFFFRDGDRVVIIGDSITEQHLYSNYVEMWTVSRFPKWNITFRNVGIGGDRSTGGNNRFKRDVLIHKPTAMTVDFGMNDGNYRAFDGSRPICETGAAEIGVFG